MAKQTSAWEDRSLRSLARRQVALPVEAVELTQEALRRRANRLVLIMAAAEFVAIGTIFAVAGVFPGFIDQDRITVEGDAELWLAVVLIGLPAAARCSCDGWCSLASALGRTKRTIPGASSSRARA